ncbi:Maf family protein [Celerinatantimonas yamalensis]|uniref:7-methyl-GTP pyrophosphatase n=1 Tax=Celerinatantimonas yamalensis TaxID=559956 RepID=A0ABW9G2X9_9GAMM
MYPSIILASSSKYRQQLLKKIAISFKSVSPDIDESPFAGESASELVVRLAVGKAQALAVNYPNHLIIGSDQVCAINGHILGKPHSVDNAIEQLRQASGQTVRFFTGLALLNTQTQHLQQRVETFDVQFRQLSEQLIRRYVAIERPLDCAGSFKSEGSGIVLFEALRGNDPNTLIGLPLIRLVEFLTNEGVELLSAV